MKLLCKPAAWAAALCLSPLSMTPALADSGAQFTIWVGGSIHGSRNWSDPANWRSNSLPDAITGAEIDPTDGGGPILGDAQIAQNVLVNGNTVTIAATGSLSTNDFQAVNDSAVQVLGGLTASRIDNQGRFEVDAFARLGTHGIDNGSQGSFDLRSSLVTQRFSNDGLFNIQAGSTLTIAPTLDSGASYFRNTGNLSFAGTINLPATMAFGNADGVIDMAGGRVNGGVVGFDGNAHGADQTVLYGQFNAGTLKLSGVLLVDAGKTLAIAVNDAAGNSGTLGALAASSGSGGVLSITARGSQPFVNSGSMYAARLAGSAAGTEGVLELVGNDAGTTVLLNQGEIEIEGRLVARSPVPGGSVLVRNDGSITFEKGSQLQIDAAATLRLEGSSTEPYAMGTLLLDHVDIAAPAGATLAISGQSITGLGSIAFTPAGALGNIVPVDPGSGVPGQLTLTPSRALEAGSLIVADAGSTLLVDLRQAQSLRVGDRSDLTGRLILQGPSGAGNATWTTQGDAFIHVGGVVLLRGGHFTFDGPGSLQIQGAIQGDSGSESLRLDVNGWNSGAPASITRLAALENVGALGTSAQLTIAATSVSNNGILAATDGGHLILDTPQFGNAGTVTLSGPASRLDLAGAWANSGSVNIGAGTQASAASFQQTSGDTLVDGTLSAALVDLQGGVLRGNGVVVGTLQVGPGATVLPGASPGHLRVQGDLVWNGGEFDVEVAGAEQGVGYDWLDIGGAAHVTDGRLHVTFEGGFTPVAGESFAFLTAGGGFDGNGFTQISVDGLGSAAQWSMVDGRLVITSVPEPSSWMLIAAGLLLTAPRLRRLHG